MSNEVNSHQIILASQSPRRQELLAMTGIKFEVKVIPDIDEEVEEGISVDEVPVWLAKKKQKAYKAFWNQSGNVVITADTIVCLNNEVLNKPLDKNSAKLMLSKLSGKKHRVITGVVLKSCTKEVAFSSVTEVWFKQLSGDEINYYVETYQPMDKAGAYGIQEWIGLIGISRINGSYFNVVGLPVDRLYDELKSF
ncbi:Maf family nucleotide pyrophosphatase [Natronoflexus pectinivorans]|uniref:dTTP/UTP pyrophosphatase n=1 Tax=Natronoflexus pectinivorans TaxID=682526 RepID=A0A4R2GJV8_9BACT|nr:Maf family nucleotide pyrophosphatase [Natronoflexus pectinivorans]TCO08745.1 septum formation protein [Natronoflexus pectinivorans]